MTTSSRRSALRLFGAVGAVAMATTSTSPAFGGETARQVPEDLRPGGALDRLAAELAAKDQFSGSMAVIRRGWTVLRRSYGMANRQTGVRNGPRTSFGLASVTKLFTAVAIHHLAQRGRLRYGDRIGAHLDGFPAPITEMVTIHHLLTHTSGLGDFRLLPGFREASRHWSSHAEVLDGTVGFIRRSELAFAPGTGNLYSNSGYCLLGAIVAAASGRSYYDYVAESVFDAAGMRDSGFFTKPRWRSDSRIARPYARLPGVSERTDNLDEHLYVGLPAGDAFATCADLERFVHALMSGKLLTPPYAALMLGAKVPLSGAAFVGYGAVSALEGGQWVHGHGGGSTLGASTSLEVFPDGGWTVVVLCNYEPPGAEPVARLARQIIVAQ
ncbi:serine hydrolase domain-containing protein [Tenggerimyces flavus]|uniref:Serine hydrolase domain-containing protein n=1 Tax=Tenggerimyces flavus TaxID=1708749 RepID=A0ABV7YRZ5_9ACTN|nr:serine hydrolase domain-containing protein [Tenggerimyces flavus]MBM7790123.1 CubicO group peptidase (beta-lactamase class C family) [Tenggerimyces flavus]